MVAARPSGPGDARARARCAAAERAEAARRARMARADSGSGAEWITKAGVSGSAGISDRDVTGGARRRWQGGRPLQGQRRPLRGSLRDRLEGRQLEDRSRGRRDGLRPEAAPRRGRRPHPRPPPAAPRRRRTRRRARTRPQAAPARVFRRDERCGRRGRRHGGLLLPRSPNRRRSSRRPAPRATGPRGRTGAASVSGIASSTRGSSTAGAGSGGGTKRPAGRVAQEERVVVAGSRPSGRFGRALHEVARGQHLDPRREVALNAHAVGLLRGSEPQHVSLADGGLALDPGRVHVEPARRVRVVHDRLVEVRPDPGVDGADAGEVHDQVAVGIGADQDLGDDFLGVVAAAVEGASEHGERDEAQVRVGHRWILGTSITAGQGILVTPPRRRAAARGTP